MKKLSFSIVALVVAVSVSAQSNPIDLLPNERGNTVITECYDAAGNLRGTTKYMVSANSQSGSTDNNSIEIEFVMTDGENQVIDYGTVYADYIDGAMNVRMSNRPEVSDIYKYLSMNTKLMNDFFDYPDPFADNLLNPGPFAFDAAEYTIKTGEKNRDFVNVKVSGRDWVKDEKITTPAGEFDASKITFDVEIYNNDTKETHKYKGEEWFAVGAGIVRSEIHDINNNLVDYTIVTELRK